MSCSVAKCSNFRRKDDYEGTEVKYYCFPNRPWETERRETWIRFCRRQNPDGTKWAPGKTALICSKHFYKNERSQIGKHPGYNPTIFEADETNLSSKGETADKRLVRFLKRQKRDIELSVEDENAHEVKLLPSETDHVHASCWPVDQERCTFKWKPFKAAVPSSSIPEQCSLASSTSVDTTPQVAIEEKAGLKTPMFCGYNSVVGQSGRIKYLTGLEPEVFGVFLSLIPNGKLRSDELSNENKLLLFCMRCKLDLSFASLGVMFSISHRTSSRYFHSVLEVLYQRTENWITWPSQKAVRITMPQGFKEHYPKCRVIIDCTEIKCEMPSKIEDQNHMYSSYKGTFTLKYLVGIAPSGLITFMSKGYGGRSTDTQITNDCGILNLLQQGDVILADKGFPNIQLKHNSIIVMPPFSSKNQLQFTDSQMKQTYKVARLRIHVERAIQRLKVFKILSGRFSVEMFHTADKLMHVLTLFANFSKPIIKQ